MAVDVSVLVHSVLNHNNGTRLDFPITQGNWAVSVDSITVKPLEAVAKLCVAIKTDIVISDQLIEEAGYKILSLPSPLHTTILQTNHGQPSILLPTESRDFFKVNNASDSVKVILEDVETGHEIKPLMSMYTVLKFKKI